MNQTIKRTIYLTSAFLSSTALVGCSVNGPLTAGGGNVQYGDAKAVETVTNEFGSTDLQSIAESMSRSLLQSRVISGAPRPPILTVAEVKNKTAEYIDTASITTKIRTQLMKSGAVQFTASISEMQGQMDEIARQNSGAYAANGQARTGRMRGSQYRLEGSISSIVKRSSNVKDVYYVFNLSLFDSESGMIVWEDEKEIRKTSLR
ncbi:penicillin-binding protein activator LpoB [Paraburkholderia sp. J63]|uniref:penicillin-binding protein activator LpoB n=1 Tax=Paraburkholderia sp. J63 TaxID=2805434 RepID=UPI002ABDD635|nr:penicillin-binding protein activator LpoB [Paraburkholderia sp. J63]